MPDNIQQYAKLESPLVLFAGLNNFFGHKVASEGWGERSRLYHHLIARGSWVKISRLKLINLRRTETLRREDGMCCEKRLSAHEWGRMQKI